MSRRDEQLGDHGQLPLDFEQVLSGAQVASRETYDPEMAYDPVGQTADYARRIVEFERQWSTTIRKARDLLLQADARQLYFDFLQDVLARVEANGFKARQYADLVRSVAHNGLGMSNHQIRADPPGPGGSGYRTHFNAAAVAEHLERHIVGPNFLNVVEAELPEGTVIGASDVSQHVSRIPLPARFFKKSVPFVLNNAAGSLFTCDGGTNAYEPLFNPRPDEHLLRWMLIDPSYEIDLDEENYRRCLGSSMDVGHYHFDHQFLLNGSRRIPGLILRDGSLLPQDAYLDNFAIPNRRGDFVREAVRRLVDCLLVAKEYGVVYAGVVKRVNLRVFSAPLEWFIQRHVDATWEVGAFQLTDGEAMSFLLPSPDFKADGLDRVVGSCLIRRSFTTRATLNVKVAPGDLPRRLADFQRDHQDFDLKPYERLCDLGQFWMCFLGHSPAPQQRLPRYEFFAAPMLDAAQVPRRILGGLRRCSLAVDTDHSFMTPGDAEETHYLIPQVTQEAHRLSKQVGRHIDSLTGRYIMSRFRQGLPPHE